MHKTAKTVDLAQNETPEAALRDRISQIVRSEFGGNLAGGIWLVAAQRAAQRVVEVVVRDWKMPHSGAPEA
jgi:hypothetical protein